MDEWTLPRSTSSLSADWIAAARAWNRATTDDQRAAVQLRVESLVARRAAGEINEWERVLAEVGAAARVWLDEIRAALAAYYPVLLEMQQRMAENWRVALAMYQAEQRAEQVQAPRTGPALPALDPRRRR